MPHVLLPGCPSRSPSRGERPRHVARRVAPERHAKVKLGVAPPLRVTPPLTHAVRRKSPRAGSAADVVAENRAIAAPEAKGGDADRGADWGATMKMFYRRCRRPGNAESLRTGGYSAGSRAGLSISVIGMTKRPWARQQIPGRSPNWVYRNGRMRVSSRAPEDCSAALSGP
jgi:hypothetical protein